ncbi:hypothetical protein M0804_003644 [Polistes exclamans]|nr:hypothetical protein M0804_003644 [Polistes exclamans]
MTASLAIPTPRGHTQTLSHPVGRLRISTHLPRHTERMRPLTRVEPNVSMSTTTTAAVAITVVFSRLQNNTLSLLSKKLQLSKERER